MSFPSYINAENSAEWSSGPPEDRYVDSTFFPKISGKLYPIWNSMTVKYNRENYATTANLTFPRYHRDIHGNKTLIFDEKAYIRSENGTVGPRGKPLVEIYFANEMVFYGIADDMTFSLKGENAETVTFACRDLMGELAIDKLKAGEDVSHNGNTTGEIVKKYVEEVLGVYGITCVVEPATVNPIGSFADSKYRFIPANKSRLDIIADMAAFDDRIFYLRGNKFYFVKPKKAIDFPTLDVVYEKDCRDVEVKKNWSSENLIVEGYTKETLSSRGKNISKKAQPILERVGHGSIVVKVPTNKTWIIGEGRNRTQAREILRAYLQKVYDKMTERILAVTLSDMPGRIDRREFNFKIRLLNVGLGLSQHYLPMEITHSVTPSKYRYSMTACNVPEGAEEALQGGTFAPGEFEPED